MFFKKSKGLNAPPERVQTDAGRRVSSDAIRASGRMPADDVASPFYLYFHTEDGPMFDPYRIPGSRSLHEQKMATWALLIGETYSSAVHAQTRRRPHRGMLPDVDFSRAVPDPSRPSLVRRIIRLIRPKIRTVTTVASASSNQPVGETSSASYIGRSNTGDSGESEPSAVSGMRSLAA
ncbi:hypothetical protein LGH82_26830 [Mesorhizobium sp. PAMC28654]|uniref:hypothetical protein n=1 Tax=Mesorhizobium sp. PAMC28654 TaxID=2880934 RepID=UPI001D0A648C|nr:hypothetical protein [Mesorhizobium sp. PAMC28654]UDL88700.1 hypothetical protein LGH82_26830 [Mesorhizobium sp. PAMC28654]